MIKMMEEINNMQAVIDKGIVSPRDLDQMDDIIKRGYTIIGWLEEQKEQITSALYDKDTGLLVFDMQNTTGLDFKRIHFDIIADGKRHPVAFYHWKNGEYEKVHVTHFFKDLAQAVVTIDVESVAYELMDGTEEEINGSLDENPEPIEETAEPVEEQIESAEDLAASKEQARHEVLMQCVMSEDNAWPSKEEMTSYLKYLGFTKEEIKYAIKELDDDPADNAGKDIWIKMQRLRILNHKIDDPDISSNVDELTELGMQIAGRVKSHPEKKDKVRRFRNYYLPTLLTNLKRYEEVEEYNSESNNHIQIRQSVEEMLDACRNAFQTIYDSLYEDDIIETDVDKNVMKALMKMDGLLEE